MQYDQPFIDNFENILDTLNQNLEEFHMILSTENQSLNYKNIDALEEDLEHEERT